LHYSGFRSTDVLQQATSHDPVERQLKREIVTDWDKLSQRFINAAIDKVSSPTAEIRCPAARLRDTLNTVHE